MEKQTFSIPDGCKTVTVEQVGNQIITTFEPEKYVPKVGDCVKRKLNGQTIYGVIDKDFDLSSCVCVYKNGEASVIRNYWACVNAKFEQITPEELQSEFNKLGYEYDFETHTAKMLRWKPKKLDSYWFICSYGETLESTWYGQNIDINRFNLGNCFETKEEAEKFRDYIKAYKP